MKAASVLMILDRAGSVQADARFEIDTGSADDEQNQ
jgi:hypothetical protein